MKYLIFGADGQLGRSLQDDLAARNLEFAAFSRADLDITDLTQVRREILESNADIIFNAAAYTNVEQAELEPEKAFGVNETGVRNLARVAGEIDARFIHFSTDYVFSGARETPWKIDSQVRPISVYGKSKLAGEVAIFEEYPENSLIIRTAWLYSAYGKNFYKTILKLALRNSDPIKVVTDQFGQPTHARELAKLAFSATDRSVPAGIYHGSNSGSTNWHNFAVEIFRLAGADTGRVLETSSRDYISGVSRPEYSVLDNSRWLDFGIKPLGSWQESVSRAFPAIQESLS